MLKDLINKGRSYRRFDEGAPVKMQQLRDMVEFARLSPSGANKQPLKFILSCDRETNAKIFPTLAWAGYLQDWPGPSEGERPTAYVIILGDKQISSTFGVDHGIAAQSMMLAAVEMGYGCCMIGSIQRDALRAALNVAERFDILLVLAIGKPKEKVVIDPAKEGDIKYWRDSDSVHHVPKRSLDELIVRPDKK